MMQFVAAKVNHSAKTTRTSGCTQGYTDEIV